MYDIGLYPPIFNQSYAPAFIYNGTNGNLTNCKIYFQISSLNSIEDIKYGLDSDSSHTSVQVSIKWQKTNGNALNTNFRNGILLKKLQYDENRKEYYIQINNSDINGGFQREVYYKVQIRFTGKDAENPPLATGTSFGTWLTNNVEYFSQWSSTVLIECITKPVVSLRINSTTDSTVSLTTNVIKISGQVDLVGKEKIEKYNLILSHGGTVEEDSGDIYTPSNMFQYIIEKALGNGTYTLLMTFTTTNLYSWTEYKTIQITNVTPSQTNIILEEQKNDDGGYAKLTIKRNPNYSSSSVIFAKNYRVIIRRCSSRDNFTRWSILADHIITKNSVTSLQFYDYTLEPGVWYRYQVIRYNNADIMTAILNGVLETPSIKNIMLDTNDIFLNSEGKGLVVKFDPSVTNLTNKVVQSVTETLGSKYPFIRHNGNVNYKTFSLSGTISYFMDIQNNLLNASKEDVFGSSKTLYTNYNQQNNINVYNDYFYEKFFREKVIDFLQSHKVKLFRSLSQGNILVKLSNVTLTPNQSLNRMIYDFSCTAYEIAECNAQNYIKYNILQDIKQIGG